MQDLGGDLGHPMLTIESRPVTILLAIAGREGGRCEEFPNCWVKKKRN